MAVLGIYGAGGLGRELLELASVINERTKRWKSTVFIDDAKPSPSVCGKAVLSYAEAKELFGQELEIVLAIGEPATREKLFSKIKADGISTPSLIHPNVYIPKTVSIGDGVVIQDGCYISCNVTIKDYAFLQPRCSVGHDCVLNEGCIISTFDTIAGAVSVGKYTYIGMSTAVKEAVTIGDYSIVGMSSAVYKDIPNEVIALGNPARPVKKNEDRQVFGKH